MDTPSAVTPRGLALQPVLQDQRGAVADQRTLSLPQAQIDGHSHGSEQQAGVERLDELGPRRQGDRDTVPGRDSEV